MKKILFLLLFVIAFSQFGSAQEIGIRFGDAIGGNVAIDGVFGSGQFSRIHADLSFGNNGVGLEALWDFLYRPLDKGFNWYVGAGPTFYLGDPFWFGVSGEIGIEYHFDDIPLALGVDWRPTFLIVEETDFEAGWFGFNIRYVFN